MSDANEQGPKAVDERRKAAAAPDTSGAAPGAGASVRVKTP